ncbi:cellulose biosynthesis protein BcsD [Variovorax sp. N23]|uniref:cellulose biosynthesis protein BcsD n=1 Tax=Variovorax sp. N23 TaxID=2980555 RepID=UPI0021C756B4|nr:cellulose biosynthesis protein BcsD [Variovorax sp. N23]MCU4117535.1 hypothetical protein [Variovorax sp. N23]
MTLTAHALAYYERTACSAQWLAFNRSLAIELSAGLPPEENRRLFARIGARVAQQLPLARCDTLEALEGAFNARWEAIGWGFARLEEGAETLSITHACSPLGVAFGADAAGWTRGFLEGAYQTWFQAQGSPVGLRVQAVADDEESAGTQVRLALGKFAE